MGKQTFDRAKKILGVLLVVFFVISITAASVSAAGSSKDNNTKTGCEGKEIPSVTGKSSVTATDPPDHRDFDRHYGDFDRDFNRNFDRDFDEHFRHFRVFDRDYFDRHFRIFHEDFDRHFHEDFDRNFRDYY